MNFIDFVDASSRLSSLKSIPDDSNNNNQAITSSSQGLRVQENQN